MFFNRSRRCYFLVKLQSFIICKPRIYVYVYMQCIDNNSNNIKKTCASNLYFNTANKNKTMADFFMVLIVTTVSLHESSTLHNV